MNRILYLMLFLLFSLVSYSQSTFENRIKMIKNDIEIIKSQEKETLRLEVEAINDRLDKGEITSSEAEIQKKAVAEKCADRIESRIEPLEKEIQALVKGEVEDKDDRIGNLEDDNDEDDEDDDDEADDDEDDDDEDANEEENEKDGDKDGDKEYRKNKKREIDFDGISIDWKPRKHKKYRGESRTTTQFVFAFGLNNLVTDGDLGSIEDNGIKLSNSRFYEWGWTWKTRMAQNSPFLHLKYGLSFTYNNLRPENNQYFIKTGDKTVLADHPESLQDEPYFRNINMVVPVHLEFDFSKKRMSEEAAIIRTQKTFRMGVGGYAGINIRSKQLLEYKADGLETEQTTRGDYNTNDFIYGLSAYFGYKDVSLYTKYDLNPLFTDNDLDQNNISLGLRFDFH
jgi:hypothetical protein